MLAKKRIDQTGQSVETCCKPRKLEMAGKFFGWFNFKKKKNKTKEVSYDTLMEEKLRLSSYPPIHDYDQNVNITESRRLMFNEALKFLESNNIMTQKMALCGMAGVGKTTMMEELRKAAMTNNMFDYVIKVVVGPDPYPMAVQQSVAEYVGVALAETTNDTRAKRLMEKFEQMSKNGKKVLLVLDDVWECFNLIDIGLPDPLPHSLKLLLTSQSETVCFQMGVESSSIFRVTVLEESEATKFFWQMTSLDSTSGIEPSLRHLGEDIVKRCGGLPLALKVVASMLRGTKDVHEWKRALLDLSDEILYYTFMMSYDNLTNDNEKAIFLLSGLFPTDDNIVIEDLLMYGWGLKLFKNEHTIASARRQVNACVNNLIHSNLLIKSDREGCVKMHCLIRDFVLSNFSKVKQASIDNHGNNIYTQLKEEESYKRILLKCLGMFEFPVDFIYPNLALLALVDGDELLKFPEDFYTRMTKLEVVAYKNMHRPLLPRYSTSLRALCLYSCSLVDDDISSLGYLINIEVLSLVNCCIERLPSEIRKLRNLKLLNLNGCVNLSIDNGVLQKLRKLEELYLEVSEGSSIKFTSANCYELEVLSKQLFALELEFFRNKVEPINVSFQNLERFRISMGCLLEKNTSVGENTLKLLTTSRELLECKINELFPITTILHLEVDDMSYVEDILVNPPQNSFGNLKAMSIVNCIGLAYIFTTSVANHLRNLERLEIRSCPILKSVVHDENNETAVITFPKLKILCLHNLPELISLCDHVTAMELPKLVELTFYNLPHFTNIIPGNKKNIPEQPLFNKEVMCPKLEKLILNSMNNLKEIWPCEVPNGEEEIDYISKLRMIEVIDCNSMVNLFPSNAIWLLSHLEDLIVKRCGSIEVLFNDITDHSRTAPIPRSTISTKHKLPNLKILTIDHCERLKYIFTHSTLSTLKELKMLAIRDCEAMEAIVRQEYGVHTMTSSFDVHFPRLKSIELAHLPKLEGFFLGMIINFHWPVLDDVRIIDCPHMSKFTDGLSIAPNLKFIHTKLGKHNSKYGLIFYVRPMLHLTASPSVHHVRASAFHNLKGSSRNFQWRHNDSSISMPSPSVEVRKLAIQNLMGSTRIDGSLFTPSPGYDTRYLLDSDLSYHGRQSYSSQSASISEERTLSFHNLIECNLEDSDDYAIFPSSELQHLQNLETIHVRNCYKAEEVFEEAFEAIVKFTKLREMDLYNLPSLKYIWKINEWSILEFPCLTTLSIDKCDSLEHVFTYSMVGWFMQLKELHIQQCKNMKVIVKEDEDCYATLGEIKFPSLKSLTLENLSCLEVFYLGNEDVSFPSLDTLIIMECPVIKIFTKGSSKAREQTVVETNSGSFNVGEDINSFVMTKIQEGFSFTELESSSGEKDESSNEDDKY